MKNVKTRPRFTNEKGFIALTHIFRRLERSFIKMLIKRRDNNSLNVCSAWENNLIKVYETVIITAKTTWRCLF